MFNFLKKKSKEAIPETLPFATDIHSHILPGIDDGSPDIETSLELIQGLYDLGIRKTIATPHIIGDLYRNTPQTIATALNATQAACKNAGIDIEITAAAEYMLDDYFLELLQRDEPLLTLHKNIILTEIPFSSTPRNLNDILSAILSKGYKPIMAHPERYNYFQQNFDQYASLHQIGFHLQVNILSLTGYYGKKAEKAAKFILDNKLAQLIGTDLHHHQHLNRLSDFRSKKVFHQYLGDKEFNNLDLL